MKQFWIQQGSVRWRKVLAILLVVIGLDQLSKVWARAYLPDKGRISWLSDWVALEFAENHGAFLSMGAELSEGARFWIFSIGVFFVLLWAAYLLMKKENLMRTEFWGLSLLLGGGIGNLIDRLSMGAVTDFVQVGSGYLRTGIFNLADVAIMVGVFLLLATSYFEKKQVSGSK